MSMSAFLFDLRYAARVLRRTPGSPRWWSPSSRSASAPTARFSASSTRCCCGRCRTTIPAGSIAWTKSNPRVEPHGRIAGGPARASASARTHSRSAPSRTGRTSPSPVPKARKTCTAAKVSADVFRMLGRQPALGRTFRPRSSVPGPPRVVVLSDRLWRRRFGRRPRRAGQGRCMMSGNAYTIVGVMPADFFFDQRFEFWTPWQFTAEEASKHEARWRCRRAAAARTYPPRRRGRRRWAVYRKHRAGRRPQRLGPAPGSGGASSSPKKSAPALLVSLGAVAFVLLIACLNVANLLLARGSEPRARNRHPHARWAPARLRMVRQLLTESLLLSLAGGAAGLLLGCVGLESAAGGCFPDAYAGAAAGPDPHGYGRAAVHPGGFRRHGPGVRPDSGARRLRRPNLTEGTERGRPRNSAGRALAPAAQLAGRRRDRAIAGPAGRRGPDASQLHRLMAREPGIQPGARPHAAGSAAHRHHGQDAAARLLHAAAGTASGSLPGVNSAGLIAPLPLADVDANGTFAVRGPSRPAANGNW